MVTHCLYLTGVLLIYLYGLVENSITVNDFKILDRGDIHIIVLDSVRAVSKIHCSALCSRVSACWGFTFQSSNMTCQLRYGSVDSATGSAGHTSFTKTGHSECPDEYTWNMALVFCYKLHDKESRGWDHASLVCENETQNGRLVILDTVAKHQAIVDHLRTNHIDKDVFVGGHSYPPKDEFLWTDGNRIDPTLWCPGQPDQDPMCGNLWAENGFCMDNSCCHHKQRFICEKPL